MVHFFVIISMVNVMDYNFRNKSTMVIFNERWKVNHNKGINKGKIVRNVIGLRKDNGNIMKNDVVNKLRGIK